MDFEHFLREANTKPDYNTNAGSYYKDLARKQQLIELLAKKIWDYEYLLDESLENLSLRLENYINENDSLMSDRLKNWDERIENLDDEVSHIFIEWLNDGTLEQIINHDVLGNKADKADLDKVTEQLAHTPSMINIPFSQTLWKEIESRGLNPIWFGAKGDGITDDHVALQSMIDYAYQHEIYKIIIPEGTFVTSKPLILKTKIDVSKGDEWWDSTGVKIYGEDISKSKIVKNTNEVVSGYHVEVDNKDSTFVLFTQYRDGVDYSGGQSTGVYLSDLTIENKSTNTESTVITGLASNRMNWDNLNIVNRQGKGIDFTYSYSNRFRNIYFAVKKNALKIIIGTSNTFEFLYAPKAHDPYTILSAYTNMLSVSADDATGTIFNVNGNGLVMSACGTESPKAQYIMNVSYDGRNKNTASVTALSMMRQIGDVENGIPIEDCAVIRTSGSVNIGALNIIDHAEITGNSYLIEDVNISETGGVDIGQVVYYKNYSSSTTNPPLLYSKTKANVSTNGKVMTSGTAINVRRNHFMPYIGSRGLKNHLNTNMIEKAIYLDVQDKTHLGDGTDVAYESAYNVGDVLLVNDPKQMNIAGYSVTEKNGDSILGNTTKAIPLILSGSTLNRPTTNLVEGMCYFDVSLGKPIWCRYPTSGVWVDATGTTV